DGRVPRPTSPEGRPRAARRPGPVRLRLGWAHGMEGSRMIANGEAANPVPPSAVLSDGPVVRVERLTKRYGGQIAVDDLTFSLGGGTITGFLGPNGAGKSTT